MLERKLVMVKGRSPAVGHPLLYVTTDHFLEHFGIAEMSDLPKLKEFEALLDREAAKEELQASGLIERSALEEHQAEDESG